MSSGCRRTADCCSIWTCVYGCRGASCWVPRYCYETWCAEAISSPTLGNILQTGMVKVSHQGVTYLACSRSVCRSNAAQARCTGSTLTSTESTSQNDSYFLSESKAILEKVSERTGVMRVTSAAHNTRTPNNETCLALNGFISILERDGAICSAATNGGSVDTSMRAQRDSCQCMPYEKGTCHNRLNTGKQHKRQSRAK